MALRLFLSESIEEDIFYVSYYKTIICMYCLHPVCAYMNCLLLLRREEGCVNVKCFKMLIINVTRYNCV